MVKIVTNQKCYANTTMTDPLLLSSPSSVVSETYYALAHREGGNKPWFCPSVGPSVRPSVRRVDLHSDNSKTQRLFFELACPNLVYQFQGQKVKDQGHQAH